MSDFLIVFGSAGVGLLIYGLWELAREAGYVDRLILVGRHGRNLLRDLGMAWLSTARSLGRTFWGNVRHRREQRRVRASAPVYPHNATSLRRR